MWLNYIYYNNAMWLYLHIISSNNSSFFDSFWFTENAFQSQTATKKDDSTVVSAPKVKGTPAPHPGCALCVKFLSVYKLWMGRRIMTRKCALMYECTHTQVLLMILLLCFPFHFYIERTPSSLVCINIKRFNHRHHVKFHTVKDLIAEHKVCNAKLSYVRETNKERKQNLTRLENESRFDPSSVDVEPTPVSAMI